MGAPAARRGIWGDDELERLAVGVFRLVEPAVRRAPGAFAWALVGLDLWLSPPREIAIVGDVAAPVARAALAPFQPSTVVAVGPSEDVPLLAGKDLVDGETAVYVCERFVCQRPVTRAGGAMRVCLMIEGQEGVTWDDWVRLATLAEMHGLEGLFRSDHYTAIIRPHAGALDAWATLAGLAALTKRIRLGTLVSPATFRHPSVLARMAVTVDHVSGGRVEVGLGLGLVRARARRERLPVPRRARRASSSSPSRSRSSSARGPRTAFDHEGAAYTLRGQTALPKPVQQPHPPLVLGGSVKRRFAALAARYATEVNTLGAPNDELRERKERLDRGVRGGGPRPGDARLLGDDVVLRRRGSGARSSSACGASSTSRAATTDAEAVIAERRDRWLVGTVDEVAARIEELRAIGVTARLPPAPEPLGRRDGRADRRPAAAGPRVESSP